MSAIAGRTRDVFAVLRADGRALTITQLTRLLPAEMEAVDGQGHSRIGPALHRLVEAGWVARVGNHHYVHARLGPSMNAARTRVTEGTS